MSPARLYRLYLWVCTLSSPEGLPMPRVLICTLFSAMVATLASSAPVPLHLMPKEPPLTIPTKVGTTWVYDDGGKERTLVISQAEEKDGATIVTTEWVEADGTRTPDMVVSVTAEGVFVVESQGKKYQVPCCRVKLPHRAGQKWETKEKPGILLVEGTMVAGPIERITVPAGVFDAARIDWEFTTCLGPEKHQTKFWFAHGVGLVKSDKGLKLKSFKLGKH